MLNFVRVALQLTDLIGILNHGDEGRFRNGTEDGVVYS